MIIHFLVRTESISVTEVRENHKTVYSFVYNTRLTLIIDVLCIFMFNIFQAIKKFARARHPGIYKPDYIDALYVFYHEKKPEDLVCPQTPEWKSDPNFHGLDVPTVDNHRDALQQVNAPSSRHSLFSFLEDMISSASTALVDMLTWMDAWKLNFI